MQEHDDLTEEIVIDGEPSIIRKRQNQVKIYLSESELARFKDMQRETSLSGAALIRKYIAGQQIKSTVDVQAVAEMRRQGGLFKHCAFSLLNNNIIDNGKANELVSIANEIHSIAKEVRNDFKENTED